jgi:hypothetical protein
MKNSTLQIAFFLLPFALCLLSGCQSSVQNTQTAFPKELAGDWKAEESPWVISFDENGQVVSAVHHMSGALIKPMETTIVPFEQSKVAGEQVFSCGPWITEYDANTRVLALQINIDYKTQNSPAVIMGRIEENLTGAFDETFSIWQVDWVSITEFIFGDPTSGKSIEFLTPEEEQSKGILTFRKLTN